MRGAAVVLGAVIAACGPSEPIEESTPAPADDDDSGAAALACPEGTLRIEGGVFEIGEVDPAWTSDGATILLDSFDVATFCVDALPFPGIEGTPWPSDGLGMAQLLELEPLLAAGGRRLCTTTELAVATAGPNNLRFGYGDEHSPGRCPDDDVAPPPLGSLPDCTNALGLRDFGVRSTWTRLDAAMRDSLADSGAPILVPGLPPGPGNYAGDLPYSVHGGTARLDTFYAPTAFGIHAHNWGKDSYIDDGLRVCADPSPEPALDAEAWTEALERFEETGTFTGWIGG